MTAIYAFPPVQLCDVISIHGLNNGFKSKGNKETGASGQVFDTCLIQMILLLNQWNNGTGKKVRNNASGA